ncbi:MAG: FtsX-like permease family protein [Bacteroidales bacterium]
MIINIFKVIWNQKRKNTFIALEMFMLFLILYGSGYHLADQISNYMYPENHEVENRILLQLDTQTSLLEQTRLDRQKLVTSLSYVEGVMQVGQAEHGPMLFSYTSQTLEYDSIRYVAQIRAADKALAEVLGFRMVEGQWYTDEQVNLYAAVHPFEQPAGQDQMFQAHLPVVIDRLLANKLAPGKSALGLRFIVEGRSCQVAGVTEPIKRMPFESPHPTIYKPMQSSGLFNKILLYLKVKDAGDAALNGRISQAVFSAVDNERWKITELTSLEARKAFVSESGRLDIISILLLGIFLLFMSMLGLGGILSYNINKRKPELGLLRAMGSSRQSLQWRLIIEMVMVSMMGIIPALLLLVQIPFLGLFPVDEMLHFSILGGTSVFMLLTVVLFVWYPAWKASQIEPARALKEE